jgi:AcrR family transcriptional regulator
LPASDRPVLGLRERKKAKTRAAIQQHALRLFRKQGFAATTVDQIAEAAEISPSTFFRYFPSKEDVVLQDEYDPVLLEAFKAQPADMSPVRAVREAMRSIFGSLTEEEWTNEMQRQELIAQVPELRASVLQQVARAVEMLAVAAAERAGRRPDDLAVLTFAGAVVGVAMATMGAATAGSTKDFMTLFDAALDHLESGLRL